MPDFSAQTVARESISTARLLGRPFVVFFFPKAFTPGCVRQAKGFRDAYRGLRSRGVEVVGVSTDALATQCSFSEWAGVSYPMIADPTLAIARAFGVLWPLISVAKRVTFVVDPEGWVQRRFHFELAIGRHVSEVCRAMDDLYGSAAR